MSSTPLNSKDLQRIFNALDQNQDGRLSLDELTWLLESTGVVQTSLNPEDLISLVGKEFEIGLDFDEFSYLYHHSILKTTTKNLIRKDEEEEELEDSANEEQKDIIANDVDEDEESYYLYKAFKVFDVNDDGYISSEEIEKVLLRLGLLNQNHDHLDCQRSIRAFDINSDGFLDFEEFKTMMLTVQ